jgi:hypothetical protein
MRRNSLPVDECSIWLSTFEGGWSLLRESTDDYDDDAIEECDDARYDRDKDAEGHDVDATTKGDGKSSHPIFLQKKIYHPTSSTSLTRVSRVDACNESRPLPPLFVERMLATE